MSSFGERLGGLDWPALYGDLDRQGWAVAPFFTPDECAEVDALWAVPSAFRKHVVMERHAFGQGVYRYWNYPLPPRVAALRQALYGALAPQAEALDRLTHAQGSLTLTAASKALQVGRDALLTFMRSNRWIYRGGDGHLGYQDRVGAGLLMHKITALPRENGRERMVEQVRVRSKGLAHLATALAQHEVAA